MTGIFWRWLLLFLPIATALTSTTWTAESGIRYYVPHIEVARISGVQAIINTEFTPFSVVTSDGAETGSYIEQQLKRFRSIDDVYSEEFSHLVYVQGSKCKPTVANDYSGNVILSSKFQATSKLNPGPYFMSCTGSVYRAYRLYDDPQSAFTTGLISLSGDMFEEVAAASFSGQAEAAIPVPSRLYFQTTDDKPLAGVRVGVKDVYHIKGVKTGAASRDYYSLYPPRNESAPSVQKLIDLGAIIVGKTKTSQFANGENPSADWIEVLAPFNPRGDGWQYPSSSSSGSAAAMASYDWLDAAIGTDTSGSMRFPAAYNGIFAGRHSHGGITTDGVVPVSTTLDTLGIFTRSAENHKRFVQAWYDENTYKTYSNFPNTIYRVMNSTLSGFPVTSNQSQELYDSFIVKLAAFLDATIIDFEPSVAWRESGPVAEELLTYTNMSYLAIAWWEQVKLLQKPFFKDWQAFTNSNSKPRIGPKARASFDYGTNNVTAQRYDEALDVKSKFTEWWSEVVNPADEESCSKAIYVYPVGAKGSPTYRDTYLSPPNVVVNWQVSHAAVYAGLPDYAVPIGQVEYLSRLTEVNETLPVSIGIGAARECDWMLANLMTEIEAAGITSPVTTGQVAF